MLRPGVIFVAAALAFAACKGSDKSVADDQSAKAVDEIMAADRAFNDMARDKGEQAAFLAYMDPVQGMEMQPNAEPAKGSEQIKQAHTDTTVPSPLVWEPAEAYAAKSGDFGMSWGHWHWTGTANGAPVALTGKYVTVWHKTKDGWKGLMDTGVSDKPKTAANGLMPVSPPTNNLSPTAPPPANPSQVAPPEVTPGTVPQDGEAPPPTPNASPHSSPNNPQ
jgi:ketosteroid isomerase-like protein